MSINFDISKIPQELAKHPNWVLWKSEPRSPGSDKMTKPPFTITRRRAKGNDPSTWSPLPLVIEAFNQGGFSGIGFMITPEIGIVGVDLDHVVDLDTGKTTVTWAADIVEQIGSYTEYSPSGDGLHIWCHGTIPASGTDGVQGDLPKMELYNRGYLTFTGKTLDGFDTIHERNEELQTVYTFMKSRKKIDPEPPPGTSSNEPFQWDGGIASLPLKEATKNLIVNGAPKGQRSEAMMTVLNGLVFSGLTDAQITEVFHIYLIGEKFREYKSKPKWLQLQIDKARLMTTDRAKAPHRQKQRQEQPQQQEIPKVKHPLPVTAATLRGMAFKQPEWIIPGILLPGLYIFAAKPKMGKSMMALNLAVSISTAGLALGSIPVRCPGSVIYFSMEDNLRRLKQRLDYMCSKEWPEKLIIYQEWGGIQFVESVIADDTKLIIIDTLQRTRDDRNAGKQDLYQYDYKSIAPLQTLAAQKNIAILIIHHLRKSDDDDPHSCISGSLGLTGAADGTWVLKRKTGAADAILYTQGRDFEGQELALKFHPENFMWELLGDAVDIQSTGDRQAVYDAIKQSPEPMKGNTISQLTGVKLGTVSRILFDYLKNGQIEKVKYGFYKIKPS
jgi:AAA domain